MLWRFILPLDLRAVRQHLAVVLRLLGLLFAVPAAVAAIAGEWRQAAVIAALAAGAVAVGWFGGRGKLTDLGLREAIVVTALAYLTAALLGAPAFLTVAPPVDAVFESMSGFTTTGLTLLDVEVVPPSVLFFRAYAQWIGGAGIVVLSLAVLAGAGGAAAKLYTSESGETNLLGSVLATGRVVVVAYGVLTLAAFLSLVAAGAGWWDGLLHSLSLVSTGGFTPFGDSIGGYDSAVTAGVTIVFMILGAVSFPLFYVAWRGEWRRVVGDAQLRLLLVLVAVGTSVALLLGSAGGIATLFHITSAATGTGFFLEEPSAWTDGTRLLAVGHMFVGGATGSTTGGLKLLRTLMILLLVAWAITRVMVPRETKVPLRIQHVAIDEDDLRRALVLFVGLVAMVFVSALLLTSAGVPLADALFEATSASNTVGLSAGVAQPELPAWAKLVLTVNMWAGRVEVVPVLVLLHPLNWRRNTTRQTDRRSRS